MIYTKQALLSMLDSAVRLNEGMTVSEWVDLNEWARQEQIENRIDEAREVLAELRELRGECE